MKTKFTNTILYGYLVIFMIISISSLGYYIDSLNPTIIQVIDNIELESKSFASVFSIEWDRHSYADDTAGDIKVIAPEMNTTPVVDSFRIPVFSDTDTNGIDLTVTETGDETGVFTGKIFFSSDSLSSGARLQVREGDTVTAIYNNIQNNTIIRTPESP